MTDEAREKRVARMAEVMERGNEPEEDDYEYLDPDELDDDELEEVAVMSAWEDDTSAAIARLESELGRGLMRDELDAVVADAIRAEVVARPFDAKEAIDGFYAQQGESGPYNAKKDFGNPELRTRHMARIVREAEAEQEGQEPEAVEAEQDAAEG